MSERVSVGGTYINYGINFTFGPSMCVGGALPLKLPENILKPTPLQLPEGTHQRDLEEAEEDLKPPAPEGDLKKSTAGDKIGIRITDI